MNENERKRVGDVLRFLRNKQGLTLEQVSRHIGKSTKSVQLYETGGVTISLDVIIDLSRLYNVTVDEILRRAGI